MSRRIIRPGQWESLRRRARDAVYPNPPEPTPAPAAPSEPEPARSIKAARDMDHLVTQTVREMSPAPVSTTVSPGDSRVFTFTGVMGVTLRGKALIDAAGDPSVAADLAERADWVMRAMNSGCTQAQALAGLDDLCTNPNSCEHLGKLTGEVPEQCNCPGYCSCRQQGHCPPLHPIRFAEPAKLLRQWDRELFEMPTVEVAALLTLDKTLAHAVIGWARAKHTAWVIRHGRSLVQLEVHHQLVRYVNRPTTLGQLVAHTVRPSAFVSDTVDAIRCNLCMNYPETRTLAGTFPSDRAGVQIVVLRCGKCSGFESFYVRKETGK